MDAPGGTAQGAGAVKRRFCRCLLTAILLTAGVFTHAAVLEPGTPEFVVPAYNQKIVAVAQTAGERSTQVRVGTLYRRIGNVTASAILV